MELLRPPCVTPVDAGRRTTHVCDLPHDELKWRDGTRDPYARCPRPTTTGRADPAILLRRIVDVMFIRRA